jgi:hypothetical protein
MPWLFTDPSEPHAGICSNIDGGSDGLVLIPWLFTDPSEPHAGICSNFDGDSDGLVLIPRLLTDPSEPYAGICSNFDGGGLCSGDGLFNALHEVLRISHQHIRGFQVLLCSLNIKRYLNSKNVF